VSSDSQDPAPLIELRGVGKRFGANRALRSIDLNIAQGDALALIGTSGSGKTLILKCIMGLLIPDAGRIHFQGRDVTRFSARERRDFLARFGMTFQRSGLFDGRTVWENVAFQVLQEGMNATAARALAVDKLAAVGLDADTVELYPAELSGGMQKRVGLARAIANDPEILFLDEPTAGLDPIMTNVITDLIVRVAADLKATVVSITSDMSNLAALSKRVAMVHDGEIIWDGATGDVMASGHPAVDQFVHSRAEGPIDMAVRAV
jgi:phospholipid/cholesterol/gamma-HCH transport system ATP-binding protein